MSAQPALAPEWPAAAGLERPVRVLRIVTRMNVGGPAWQVGLLSSRLPDRYGTLLVTGRVGPGEREAPPPDDIAVEILESLQREPRPVSDARAFASLVRIVRGFRPDIVHTHTAKAGFLGRFAAAAALRPRPIVVHTYEGHVLDGYFGRSASAAFLRLERAAARVSDRLLGVSAATVKELVELGVAPADRFRVVPLGLDLEPYARPDRDAAAAFRRDAGTGDGDVLVTFVGRLVTIKRVDVALRAVAEARGRGAPVRLAVVGDGELRPELEALAEQLGVGDAVRFFGYRADIPQIAAATDLAVLPSDREGLGAWLVEAAAAGRPAVASRVGGIPEVVAEGCGITAPSGDVHAFATALERFAADPALRRLMGERARAHVALRFSGDRMLLDVDALYRELLAARVSA